MRKIRWKIKNIQITAKKTRSLITDAKGRLLIDTCLKLIGERKNGTRCFVSILHFSISLFLSSFSPLQAIEKAIYLLRRGCSSSRWLSRRVLLTKENGIPSIGWSHRRRIMARSLFFVVALLLLGGWKGKDEFVCARLSLCMSGNLIKLGLDYVISS
ncbi:hypothetical protein YC2023_116429 [Brassica napus]